MLFILGAVIAFVLVGDQTCTQQWGAVVANVDLIFSIVGDDVAELTM